MTAKTTYAASAASAWRSRNHRKNLARRANLLCAQKSLRHVREQPPQRRPHRRVGRPRHLDLQQSLIHSAPATYFKPPYVGVRGWIGVELRAIGDEELAEHIREAWRLIAPKTLQ